MNKKRIILIRNAKSYDFGGGERFPVFIADILKKSDYDPIIISKSLKLLKFAADQNIPTVKGLWWSHQNWSGRYALLFPIYLVWQIVLLLWYTVAFLRLRPYAIHIQSKDDFIAATLAGHIVRARIIWTDHADLKHVWQNLTIWYKNPVGKLIYSCAHFAHAITVVSKSERNFVTAHLPAKSKLKKDLLVVYNGVLDNASQFSVEHKNDDFIYCAASRLVTDKGIKELIQAYRTVHSQIPNSKLLLLGDGPEAVKFHKLARDVPSIIFLGHQTNPLNTMSQADAFVHPTYHEGFSVALVEAGMLSLPIIATAIGGNVEIISDKETGLLVPVRNSSKLAEAMRELAVNTELRQRLGKSARKQYLERFQFDHIVRESFIPLYEGGSL